MRSALLGRITPADAVAVYEDDAARHQPIIDPRLAVALGKGRFQPCNLLVGSLQTS